MMIEEDQPEVDLKVVVIGVDLMVVIGADLMVVVIDEVVEGLMSQEMTGNGHPPMVVEGLMNQGQTGNGHPPPMVEDKDTLIETVWIHSSTVRVSCNNIHNSSKTNLTNGFFKKLK